MVRRRVLLVGCGDLGSRHLQAIARIPDEVEIEVVDPRPEALALGRARLNEVGAATLPVRWYASLDEASRGGDLCILATRADVRVGLMSAIAEQWDYGVFLLEKLVAQSVHEYEDALALTHRRGLATWVNCKSRAYPVHQHVKAQLARGEPIVFSSVGGNHGLATNGIHDVDLFVFFDDAPAVISAESHIDDVVHPSKRAGGFYDLSGALHGYSERGSHLLIGYGRDHLSPPHQSVTSPRYRCIVDAMQRWAVESDAASGWAWRPLAFTGNLLVSQMTAGFVMEIFRRGRCDLPTLADCYPAHGFILGELAPVFARLLGTKDGRCPVT